MRLPRDDPELADPEASAAVLRQRLDRINRNLDRATIALDQLDAALGLGSQPQPSEKKMTKQNNQRVAA